MSAATRQPARCDTAMQACDTAGVLATTRRWGAPRYGHVRAPRRACAHLGVLAGPAGCALGAPSLFLAQFDSVLFLSQFLDIVRELGS